MHTSFFVIVTFILSCIDVCGQKQIATFEAKPGFSKNNEAAGYFSTNIPGYIINLEVGRKISRFMYDTNFVLTKTYSFDTKLITFSKSHISAPVFASELILSNGHFEIYADDNTVKVIRLDFDQQRDSTVYKLELTSFHQQERRLAILPYSRGLRVLSYSQKKDKLYLYQWDENDNTDTVEFDLPGSSLSAEEVKIYSRDARVRYKNAFDHVTVTPANASTVVGNIGTNTIAYSENRIWLLMQIPYYLGYHLLELDIKERSLVSKNFIINNMRENNTASVADRMIPYAGVMNDWLVMRNSSYSKYQLVIYDIATKQMIREFKSTGDSIESIINSDLNQKGTWLAAGDEKKLDNERAFLRKLASGSGFIIMSQNDKDSITITTASLKPTSGVGGLILSIGTGFLGYMANLTVGNYQIIPFLQLYRNKLVYCHTRLSKKGLNLSENKSVVTALDLLLDNFEKRDLRSSSSLIIRKDNGYLVGVFNNENGKYEMYKLKDD